MGTCYYSVFNSYGITHDDLSGTGFDYIDSDIKFVCGYDYDTRMGYLRQAQTSFLISIIVVQWADVMICKTRSLSIFQQGMWNSTLNIGLLEETLLGMCLVYVPFMNAAFKTASLDFIMWTYGVPFSILIFVFDETRKLMLRAERQSAEEKAKEINEKNEERSKSNPGEYVEPVLPEAGWIEKCT